MTRIFFKAPENAQTSLDRACDILYFVFSADCGHILYRLLLAARFEAALMLRCERPHRPAAYEPILVRLPQVFGAALLHWEKKRQYFSVILVLKKTASLFLGIFFLQSASLCFFRPCREKVVSSRFLVPCSYKTKNFDDIKLSMALIQRFESDTDFFQSARKRTDVP